MDQERPVISMQNIRIMLTATTHSPISWHLFVKKLTTAHKAHRYFIPSFHLWIDSKATITFNFDVLLYKIFVASMYSKTSKSKIALFTVQFNAAAATVATNGAAGCHHSINRRPINHQLTADVNNTAICEYNEFAASIGAYWRNKWIGQHIAANEPTQFTSTATATSL